MTLSLSIQYRQEEYLNLQENYINVVKKRKKQMNYVAVYSFGFSTTHQRFILKLLILLVCNMPIWNLFIIRTCFGIFLDHLDSVSDNQGFDGLELFQYCLVVLLFVSSSCRLC